MSPKIPNDEFLLYAFDGAPRDLDRAIDDVLQAARGCPDLVVRIEDGCALTYPAWVRCGADRRQVVVHAAETQWSSCLDEVAGLARHQLDLRTRAWRLHVFPAVCGVPSAVRICAVVVLQIGHALADGLRASAMAATLFGRVTDVPAVARWGRGCLVTRGFAAARAHRDLERATVAGLVAPRAEPAPVLSTNAAPGETRCVRTLVRRRGQLRGPTVTIAVLVAIATALSQYLEARGEDAATLTAEVPMAKTSARHANNHYRNVGVALHPGVGADERAALIAAGLAARRRRGRHPALAAGDRALAAVPAPLLRWGVAQFDARARAPMVTGNTVVSSVNRGPADLHFGGRPVVLTAGYPALSPMMGLTHGAHGIGDTVALSVHAATSAMADLPEYLDRLDAALA